MDGRTNHPKNVIIISLKKFKKQSLVDLTETKRELRIMLQSH